MIFLFILPAAMSLIALASLPYGYYTLLRIVVFVSGGIIAYMAAQRPATLPWAFAFGLVALLFNPIIPVHLSREIWQPIDVAVAALYGIGAMLLAKKLEENQY